MSQPPVPPDREPEPEPPSPGPDESGRLGSPGRPDQPGQPQAQAGPAGQPPPATAPPQPGPFVPPVPGAAPPVYGHPHGYGPHRSGGLGLIVTIGGWLALGLHVFTALYVLVEETGPGGADAADRLFSALPVLAQGIFYGGLLLAAGRWLERQG